MDLISSGCTVAAGAENILTLNCAGPLIVNLLSWLFTFAGIVCLLFVIFGGFKFLTSGGEKEKVEEGRKTITWALIGLIVVFTSFAIVRLIGGITGVTCISSGSFEFGRCGLPKNVCDTGTAPHCPNGSLPTCVDQKWDCGDTSCDINHKINCGQAQTVCNLKTGEWECSGGL